MALFKRKTDTPAPVPAPPLEPVPVDESLGDPVQDLLLAALGSGDWRDAARFLESLTADRRRLALAPPNYGADREQEVAVAERWIAEAPGDGWGHVVLGNLLLDWGWWIRGGGVSSTVAEDAWDVYFARLRRAEAVLWEAGRLLPDAVEPWTALLWAGIGLQVSVEELTALFDEGHRRHPFDPWLCQSILQALCEKWAGTHEQMFAFARMIATEAPAGSPAIAVLPMAHIEYLANPNDEPVLAAGTIGSRRAELQAAAARSIHHPSFVADVPGLKAANIFLMGYWVADVHGELAPILSLLQGRYTEDPWSVWGPAGVKIRECEVVAAHASSS